MDLYKARRAVIPSSIRVVICGNQSDGSSATGSTSTREIAAQIPKSKTDKPNVTCKRY